MGLKAGIWTSRLGLGSRGWDMGLEAGIWTSRLGYGPLDWDLSLKKEEKKEEGGFERSAGPEGTDDLC